ncbi:MAG TPA: LysR family transcriptional regulator [Acetobacteraceae bacterium]|nr:LysR family transcriptional regulator [Acetobacteraceae bacterium]
MELRHLRYFVAVAEEGHITRAAARLGLQQPPLSQQIRALEAELGVTLLHRLPRGVALTEAGRVFLAEARAVLASAERAATRAVEAAAGQTGELILGITTSAILQPMMARILGAYVRRYPAVSLAIQEGNAADLTEMLEAGAVHGAMLRAVVARPLGITFVELDEEPMVLALPSGHPLAEGAGAVKLAELALERFILVRRRAAPGMYADLILACRAAGFEPKVAAEVGRMLTNLTLVAAGVGVSLVPASMQEIRLAGVRYRRINSPTPLRAPLTLATRTDEQRPTVENFRRIAQAAGRTAQRTQASNAPLPVSRRARGRSG